jgi:hypothetical protein
MCAVAALVPSIARSAPSNGTTGDWTLVGGRGVSALDRFGDVVYMAGAFTGIARRAPGIAAFDTTTGTIAADLADPNPASSATTAVAALPDGGAYVASSSSGPTGAVQHRLIHYTPEGAIDPAFRPRIDGGPIEDIDVGSDGTVYVAGSFTTASGLARNGLAAFRPETGAVTGWNPRVVGLGGDPGSVTELELGAGRGC